MDNFDILGSPEETMGAAGRTCESLELYFIFFGVIFGHHFESFLGSDGLNSMFIRGLIPGHFLDRFLNGVPDSESS